jgi:hypothetical protein
MGYKKNTPIDYVAVASTTPSSGGTYGYAWVFDDGGVGSGATVPHSWSTSGDHTATVTATDNLISTQGSISKVIHVDPDYEVITLAGLYGTGGRVDANGSSARLTGLYHLSVNNSNGDIYTGSLDDAPAPYYGHCVRKMDQLLNVSTIMIGSGEPTLMTGTPIDGATPSIARSGWPFAASYNNSTGDIYISDAPGSYTSIRRVSGGISTLFAGSYSANGTTDATGASASLFGTRNISFNGNGTVGYFVDMVSSTLRSITIPGAVVTTIAGSPGVTGYSDGTGSAAGFNNPRSTYFASDGNIYIADTNNNTIRMSTPAGAVTTIAGLHGNAGTSDGIGANARFNLPYNIIESTPGVFYVSDNGNNLIRRIDITGGIATVSTVVGTGLRGGTDGFGTSASVGSLGMCWYGGCVYFGNGTTIRKIIVP